MKTIRVLFLRDLRRFALASIIIWPILVIIPHVLWGSALGYDGGTIGALFVFTTFLVFEAPLHGSSEFWMTRPISGVQLFATKLGIVILCGVLLPTLVMAVSREQGMTMRSEFQSNASSFLTFFTIGLIAMLIASLSAKPWHIFLGMVLFWLIIFIVMLLTMPALIHAANLFHPETGRAHSRHTALWWMLVGLLDAGVFFITLRQYATRDRMKGIVATGGLMLLLVFSAYLGLLPLIILKS